MHGILAQEGGPLEVIFTSTETTYLWVIFAISLLALVFAYYLVREVLAAPEGTEKMKEIARAIQEGAKAYLSRQFRTLGIFLALLTVLLFFILPAPENAAHSEFSIKFGRSLAFILGAGFSALTGYVGMWLAVRANVRTANAARESGLRRALKIAFRAGGVAGMFTVGLGLLGATVILLIYEGDATSVLVGFGFGGALLAMFMRVGGGIFTKAADVGADLVGKIEQGIPEDDPRNAAVIADNVGDNVGDCAGMAADLFESYEVTLVASLILGAAAFADSEMGAIAGVMFPLFVRAIGVITSIVGILAVTPRSETEHGMKAINRGFFLSAAISAAAVFVISQIYLDDWKPAAAVAIGLVLASVIQILTQYFTDTKYKPVQEIAESTVTGAGDHDPVWVLDRPRVDRLVGADHRRGRDGVLLPGGQPRGAALLHRAHRDGDAHHRGRRRVDGYLRPYLGQRAGHRGDVRGVRRATVGDPRRSRRGRELDQGDHERDGDRDGGARRHLACSARSSRRSRGPASISTRSTSRNRTSWSGSCSAGRSRSCSPRSRSAPSGRAAMQVVVEVRNQFRDHPGIMDYTEKPDYSRVVDICTRTSLRELTTPGLLAVLSPLIAGFFLGAEALGAFLAGSILTGQLLAVMLSNAGGAWDNAKKFIEEGHYGGKGSEAHTAAVIGDTVGDPFKDTAGPALNPLIKVMNLVALLIAPIVVSHADDTALRVAVVAIAAVVLASMIWVSKSRKSELGDEIKQRDAAGAPS